MKLTRKKFTGNLLRSLAVLLLFSLVVCTAAGEELYFEPQEAVFSDTGSVASLSLYLDQAPSGLAGYKLNLSISDPSVAQITGVEFPSWSGINNSSSLPADLVQIKAVDLEEKINAGDLDVFLGTVTVESLASGEANLTVSVDRLDDDSENTISVTVREAKLTSGTTSENPVVSILPAESTLSSGASQVFEIRADKFTEGISGYDFNLTLENPAVGKFTSVEYPSWVGLSENSSMPNTSIKVKAVDTNDVVKAGDENVLLANVTFVAETPGESEISLTFNRLDDDSGSNINAATEASSIKVQGSSTLPVAKFTATPTSGDSPLTVQFTDESTGSPTAWAWDFDNDGNVDSTEQNPSYTYSDAGIYTVKLTVSNENGSDVLEILEMITVKETVVSEDAWYQFHKDAQHSGYSSSDAPDSANLAWIAEPLNNTYSLVPSSSVVIAEGMVFGLCNGPVDEYGNPLTSEGQLVAFDEETGEEIWNVTVMAPEWGSWSCPAYDDGKVFASAGKNTYCVNASTGDIIWTFQNPSELASCNGGPSIGDGKVFASDWDGGNYYCLDENTGELLWTFKIDGLYAQSTPAYKDDRVYLSGWTTVNAVYCVNATTGELIWENEELSSNPCGSITVTEEGLYLSIYSFGTEDGFYKLDLTDGHEIWGRPDIPPTDSTPAVVNGKVYLSAGTAGYSDLNTYCLNASDGKTIWVTDSSENIGDWVCSPAVADGKVFTGGAAEGLFTGSSTLYAFDAETGAVIWSYKGCGGSPAVADDMVFSTGSGKLYAFKEAEVLLPEAKFSSNVSSGEAPLTVGFTDESTGEGITAWEWDFDNDGNVDSTEQNPVHTYDNAGSYTVNLTVTSAEGSDSEVKMDYINVSESSTPGEPEPVAAFIANVTSGTAPLTVNFTDQSTGSPTSWEWDFDNDGNVDSTEQNPVHTYTAAGNYTVSLTVTNAEGSDSEVKADYITVSEASTPVEPEPVAAFTADVTSGTAPLTVNFTDQSTGSPTAWAWDFDNDGNVDSTEQNPSYTYNDAGSYTVNLTVTNAEGSNSEVKTEYITVEEASSGSQNGSSSVSLNVTIVPVISLEVSPSALDFGELYPGKTSELQYLTLKNRGSCDINVTAVVCDCSAEDELFSQGLLLDSQLWNNYWKVVGKNSQENTSVALQVPADYAGSGNKKGSITFWAEAAE
ncbi:PKD domain-containing protein [Methanosarcina acetivorans]|nr:PKD domain-containing protein [Methanosarcina acetivorans]